MSFGQASGPPATASQVQQLLGLLQMAGHTDFRDARGPMGFTQRQAAGKFTRTEAEAFIAQLEAEESSGAEDSGSMPAAAARPPAARVGSASRPSAGVDQMLRTLPATTLAAELQRRGWVVLEP